MRTTLTIDDDVFRAARSLANSQKKPIGQVLSELARKGLQPSAAVLRGGFPVFDVSDGAPIITPEMVREALDDAV